MKTTFAPIYHIRTLKSSNTVGGKKKKKEEVKNKLVPPSGTDVPSAGWVWADT